jgi:hypothetical protein
MNTSLKQVEEQALIEQAWAQEIEERVAAFDRGDIPSCPAEDVFAQAKRLSK